MADINTLQYFTALTLSGEKEKSNPSKVEDTPRDPNHSIKIKIEKTRKGIAQLVAAVVNGISLAQNAKSYLQKLSIQEVLQKCIMCLATRSKCLRTKNANRNRYRDSKLRYEDSGGIIN